MRTRRYVKNIILEVMGSEGHHAKDLVNEVSERVGKPFSVQRVSSYLGKMFIDGEVRREEEMVSSNVLKRYKWFRVG